MDTGKPRIVRCKLCARWKWSERARRHFCGKFNHVADSPHGGCTWGEEKGDVDA